MTEVVNDTLDSENVLNNTDIFKLEWYYIHAEEQQPKGPISIRDIDVFMRTNALDSNTYVWKEGMEDWKRIYQLDELKDIVSTTHTEIQESLIRTKIQTSYNNMGQKVENSAVENFYFGADGFWHVYNPITKVWSQQEKKPVNRRKSIDFEEENKALENKVQVDIEGKSVDNINVNDDIIVTTPDKTPDSKTLITQDHNTNNDIQTKFLSRKREKSNSIHLKDVPSQILTETELIKLEKRKKKSQKQKEKKKQLWYDAKVNANVYVTNLPKDITENEIIQYFSRCGFIRKDQRNGEQRVKLYKDHTGKSKGDALISYLREESVVMAIDMLNETEIRPGVKINVERAKFEQKGDYKARETYKLDYIQRYKLKTDVDRMLGWNEEDEEKGLKIVILKYMFEPREFLEDEGLRQDLELDIIEECEKNFGEVERFMIFEEHPEGIVKIKFKTPAAAEKCIQSLNNRFYNTKNIQAFYWDGKTDYNKYKEDINSQEKRIEEFGQWLENEQNL